MKEDLLKIINNYGVIPQLKHFNSEVFELSEAIVRYEENSDWGMGGENLTKYHKHHITEEIADCLVMINQFVEYYEIQESDIYMIMEQKIDRQLDRINKLKEEGK